MLLGLLGMFSCRSIDPADVVGTWVVTTESRRHFLSAAQQKAIAKIVLETNGVFVAFEVPEDLLYGPREAGSGLVTGRGIWKLVSAEGRQQVRLEFGVITVGQRDNVPYGTHLNVSGSSSLYYFQGDPDQARRIEFEKK